MIFAVLRFKSAEGFLGTEKGPFQIDKRGKKYLFTPESEERNYWWEFYEDRAQLIQAGY